MNLCSLSCLWLKCHFHNRGTSSFTLISNGISLFIIPDRTEPYTHTPYRNICSFLSAHHCCYAVLAIPSHPSNHPDQTSSLICYIHLDYCTLKHLFDYIENLSFRQVPFFEKINKFLCFFAFMALYFLWLHCFLVFVLFSPKYFGHVNGKISPISVCSKASKNVLSFSMPLQSLL